MGASGMCECVASCQMYVHTCGLFYHMCVKEIGFKALSNWALDLAWTLGFSSVHFELGETCASKCFSRGVILYVWVHHIVHMFWNGLCDLNTCVENQSRYLSLPWWIWRCFILQQLSSVCPSTRCGFRKASTIYAPTIAFIARMFRESIADLHVQDCINTSVQMYAYMPHSNRSWWIHARGTHFDMTCNPAGAAHGRHAVPLRDGCASTPASPDSWTFWWKH